MPILTGEIAYLSNFPKGSTKTHSCPFGAEGYIGHNLPNPSMAAPLPVTPYI